MSGPNLSAADVALPNPFVLWDSFTAASRTMLETSARLLQMSDATKTVVEARVGIMQDAAASPLSGDYVELARIVPEKATAFTESALIMLRAWLGMQSVWLGQAQAASRLMTAGHVPTITELTDFWADAAQRSADSVRSGARVSRDALEPVARVAVANAKRLRRRSAT